MRDITKETITHHHPQMQLIHLIQPTHGTHQLQMNGTFVTSTSASLLDDYVLTATENRGGIT